MTGREILAMIQGTRVFILFALAISNAPALYGLENNELEVGGADGLPGCRVVPASPFLTTCNNDGVKYGDENDKRYRAMKKASFSAQAQNSTVYICQYIVVKNPKVSYLVCIVYVQ